MLPPCLQSTEAASRGGGCWKPARRACPCHCHLRLRWRKRLILHALCASSCHLRPVAGWIFWRGTSRRKLSERLGQAFYVENIAGAAGNIGTAQAARAAPDGDTVLFVFGSFVISPSLFAKPGFDPQRDFAPVTLAATTPTVLVVNPSVPAHTVGELVDHIRANRGKLSFAHGGFGTQAHLAGEQFRLALDLDLVNVPFGGAAPATASVVAGHTAIGFISLAAVEAQVNESGLRALAVTGNARVRTLPDVPTMAEAGFPGIEGDSWVGVLVPAGTPREIISVLHREIVAVITEPETKARLIALGYEPVAGTPDEFAG